MTELVVVRAGPRTTVQDGGRRGLGHLGVPVAGPVDRDGMGLANSSLGNAFDAASLESILGGDELECTAPVALAVGGARGPVLVDGTEVTDPVVELRPGQRLRLGRAVEGVYRYLAVRGGLVVPPVLGSAATDTLSGLGPAIVRAGDRFTVGTASSSRRWSWTTSPRMVVRPGPHLALVGRSVFDELLAGEWTVSPASDRTALRLAGPVLATGVGGIASEGLVPGAVQLPPDGQPVVFLANHPVTGGYPVVGVVAWDALPRLPQSRPGTRLRFTRA